MVKDYIPSEGEKEAIRILKSEKLNWEQGTVWVTNDVEFDMTDVVKKARKNYFGIFKQKYDPVTGRRKIFIPLTEWTVEIVLKNIDIDTKDIEVRAKNPSAYGMSKIFRYVLRYYLDKLNFGKILNSKLRNTAIDGTMYDKTWKEKKELMHRNVDRLNIYRDPTESEFTDKSTIIERNLLTLPEFRDYDWENMDYVYGTDSYDRSGMDDKTMKSEIPMVELHERYGYLPDFCVTSKEKDKDSYSYYLLVVSGLDENEIVHQIKKVKGNPYTGYIYKEVLNRSDGRGVPEMLFNLQAYLNEVMNTRLNTSRIAQMGLWHAKGNITPQQIKKLFTTSVLKTDLSAEFTKLNTGTVDQSSYKDEQQIYQMSQRVTQTMNEDEIAASQPATSSLIQERGSAKNYDLLMENFKLALSELIEKKFIPIIKEIITPGEILRITGDPTDLKTLDDQLARNLVYSEMEKQKKEVGLYPYLTEEEMEQEITRVKEELAALGDDRYLEVNKEMFDTDFDVDVVIGDESMNKAVVAQNLTNAFSVLGSMGVPAPLLKEPLKELFETLGLDGEKLTASIDEAQVLKAQEAQAEVQTRQEIQRSRGAEGGTGAPGVGTKPGAQPRRVVAEAEQGVVN